MREEENFGGQSKFRSQGSDRKVGRENAASCHDYYLSCQTSLPPNHPTGLKVKNVHKLAIFHRICLKLCMEILNGRTQLMYMIYMHLSMLTGQTDLPPNQPTRLKVKKLA